MFRHHCFSGLLDILNKRWNDTHNLIEPCRFILVNKFKHTREQPHVHPPQLVQIVVLKEVILDYLLSCNFDFVRILIHFQKWFNSIIIKSQSQSIHNTTCPFHTLQYVVGVKSASDACSIAKGARQSFNDTHAIKSIHIDSKHFTFPKARVVLQKSKKIGPAGSSDVGTFPHI